MRQLLVGLLLTTAACAPAVRQQQAEQAPQPSAEGGCPRGGYASVTGGGRETLYNIFAVGAGGNRTLIGTTANSSRLFVPPGYSGIEVVPTKGAQEVQRTADSPPVPSARITCI